MLNILSDFFCRLRYLFMQKPSNHAELFQILRTATARKLIAPQALEMIEGVLEIMQMQVRDLMIPRAQMIVIDFDDTPEEFLAKIKSSGHSRFPVIGENKDQVIGILLAKDLIDVNLYASDFNLQTHLRKAIFVPESKRLDVLLKEFRLKRSHIAIVIDEYNQVAGLITIENVLEEIVGDITDEHDKTIINSAITKIEYNKYMVTGLTLIEEFNAYFKVNLPDDCCDTIGGLITQHLGHMPTVGESISLGDFKLTVHQAEKRRVKTVLVER